MSLYDELIIDRDAALKNGDFETYSKLCLILEILTVEPCENTLKCEKIG